MGENEYDPRYWEYFECFNQRRFFDAHDVLEVLWLPQRAGPKGLFYKGLIQLAGAFVHWQKNRPGPAVALLNLARINLQNYAPRYDGLDVDGLQSAIESWLRELAAATSAACPPVPAQLPRLAPAASRRRAAPDAS
jgi:predicted metal-dependent hydrolase